jgi:hypothetical protein
MSNLALGFAAFAGALVAVTAWLAAWMVPGRLPDSLERLERFKLILLAVLAVVLVGLAFVLNDLTADVHRIANH